MQPKPGRCWRTMSGTLLLLVSLCSCSSKSGWQDPGFAYEPQAFRTALQARVPGSRSEAVTAPYLVPKPTRRKVRRLLSKAPGGLNPVEVLVSILSNPEPAGLGIEYDWTVSASAQGTLTRKRGNCVSLAMLLVGLGRSMDWPIYFAEARPDQPVVHKLPGLNILSSHMIVIVLTQDGPVFVDFLGLIDQSDYDIHPIDDISAYAHLLNNMAAQHLTESGTADADQWTRARERFEYVTRIQPQLGDAWNNLGIAHARLEQYALARRAYSKAIALDHTFGASEKNLTIMETRAANRPAIVSGEIAD